MHIETRHIASLVQTIDTSQFSPPSPDPAGIVYLASSDSLLISDSEVEETPLFTGDNLFEMSRSGTQLDTLTTISFSSEPTGVDINPVNSHLYISDDDVSEIFELDPGADGLYDTPDDTVTSFDTLAFNSFDPEGVAFDFWHNALFIADGGNAEIYRVAPGTNGVFDGIPPAGDDQVTHFDTESLGIIDPGGICFDPDNGHLYIVGRPPNLLAHVTTTGRLVRMIDISAANAVKPAGLTFAPGSQNPGAINMYIVDRELDNDSIPNENDGKTYEVSFPGITPGNLPPAVDAGANQSITLPASAPLDGTVTDEGLPDPPGLVNTTWRQVGGSGTVIFGDANAIDTTASFFSPGTYVLQLTADDGELSASDTVTIVVNTDGERSVKEVRVATSSDDAEESESGSVHLDSVDLDLVFDGKGNQSNQTVGIRFNEVAIPQGSEILNAFVQFTADEVHSDPTLLTIYGEDVANATTFAPVDRNITSRPRTSSVVSWSPAPWTTIGEAAVDQRTPDISSIIQEIVNQPDWAGGNSLAIIIDGSGERTADSYDFDPTGAPLLHVVHGGDILPPTVATCVPPHGATRTPPDGDVIIEFSEPIDPDTFAYIVTPDPGGWSVTWNANGDVATLSHAPADYWTTYTFTISEVADLAGNRMPAAHSWSYTTTAPFKVFLPGLFK